MHIPESWNQVLARGVVTLSAKAASDFKAGFTAKILSSRMTTLRSWRGVEAASITVTLLMTMSLWRSSLLQPTISVANAIHIRLKIVLVDMAPR